MQYSTAHCKALLLLSETWDGEKVYPTRSHPEMIGDMSRDLELRPIKNSFCAFLARVKTYTHTKI